MFELAAVTETGFEHEPDAPAHIVASMNSITAPNQPVITKTIADNRAIDEFLGLETNHICNPIDPKEQT